VWDFGDGSTPSETTEPLAEHVYNTPNTYNITLTVYDSDYASDTDKGSIKVVWPEEVINLGPAVLLGEPIFEPLGVIMNYTEMTWEVRSEAKEMNITVTIAGANFRETQTNEVSVLLLDPEGNLVNNKTVAVMGSTQIIWNFEAADLTNVGDWMLQVTCEKGASYITVQGYVSYI
jgi:PKD repeat protein